MNNLTWQARDQLALHAHMKTRVDILKLVRPRGVGAELGVADGLFSEAILKNGYLDYLYSIDMYAGDRGHDTQQYKRAIRRLMPYRNRNCIIKMRFDEALSAFDDRCLDFVYIDGYAHTAEEGGKTFFDWFPKVRPGGVIAGHDYDLTAFPMVVEAVNRFSKEVGLPIYIVQETVKDEWNMGFASWFAIVPE